MIAKWTHHYGDRRWSYLGQIGIDKAGRAFWTIQRAWMGNTNPAPAKTRTGMNLDEIKQISRVAGVWKISTHTSIEFDAQGIVKVNGSAVNEVQFSGFY